MERKENQSRQELSQQYLTDLVYFNFIRLAQTYGRDPSRKKEAKDPEKISLLHEDTRTLPRIYIPPDSAEQEYPDFISGVDYGLNVIEIFYAKGENGAKVYLKKDPKSGVVKMNKIVVFKVMHTPRGEHLLEPTDGSKVKPDISTITELLEKAERVLKEKERKALAEKFTKEKLSVKQKLSRRLGGRFSR